MNKKIDRRKFIKISSLGLVAAGGGVSAVKLISSPPEMGLPDPYPVLPGQKPAAMSRKSDKLFFDDHQYALVATLAALIVPTDEDPGATEAGVVDYIDRLVAKSRSRQAVYGNGLAWLDDLSQREHGRGKGFLNLEVKQQIDLLRLTERSLAMRNRPIHNLLERIDRKIDKIWDDLFGPGEGSRFFKTVRTDVFYGYYASPLSWKVIGYYGPPQPVGYPDYAKPPSAARYTGVKRPVDDKTCQNCHFDQTRKKSHEKRHSCTGCHPTHDAFTRGG